MAGAEQASGRKGKDEGWEEIGQVVQCLVGRGEVAALEGCGQEAEEVAHTCSPVAAPGRMDQR